MTAVDRRPGAPAGRWGAIDATRGVAMILVCFSHFGAAYFRDSLQHHIVAVSLYMVGMIASPTFVIISGVMLGYLAVRRRALARELRVAYADRGLFLLLVAHPVILAAHVAYAGGIRAALRYVFITDTFGFCLILAPPLVLLLGGARRVAAAAVGFASSWIVVGAWHPSTPALVATKELLFGSPSLEALVYVFPIVPWCCVFVAASAVGELLVDRRIRGERTVVRWLSWLGSGLLGAAIAGHLIHRIAAHAPSLQAATALTQKQPPGPVYLALYGALGIFTLALCVEIEQRGALRRMRGVLELLGRNSLFAFVAQYFVFWTALVLVHPTPSWRWPLWLVASLALVVAATLGWERCCGNGWLTVGLRSRVGPASTRAVPLH